MSLSFTKCLSVTGKQDGPGSVWESPPAPPIQLLLHSQRALLCCELPLKPARERMMHLCQPHSQVGVKGGK